jgi:hypothetical protein
VAAELGLFKLRQFLLKQTPLKESNARLTQLALQKLRKEIEIKQD